MVILIIASYMSCWDDVLDLGHLFLESQGQFHGVVKVRVVREVTRWWRCHLLDSGSKPFMCKVNPC